MIHHCFAGCDVCGFCGRCRNVGAIIGGCDCDHGGGPRARVVPPDKGPPRAARVPAGSGPLTMRLGRRKRVLADAR